MKETTRSRAVVRTGIGRWVFWGVAGVGLGVLAVPGPLEAWVAIGDLWRVPTVVITTNLGTREDLGGAPGPLMDLSESYDEAFGDAAAIWNGVLARPTLLVTRNPAQVPQDGDLLNQVFFAPTAYGQPFGEAVAITTGFFVMEPDGSQTTVEKDIVFSTGREWDSYRGALVDDSTGTRHLLDMRRVALHELGHLLGLNHPDQAVPVQDVDAIMNSTVDAMIDDLQADDIEGANALYAGVTDLPGDPDVVEDPEVVFSVAVVSPSSRRFRTKKKTIVMRGVATGGTRVVLQNLETGTSKFFPVAVDGTWKGRMALVEGKNDFIIVVLDGAFSAALTKTAVIRKDRKKRRR